MYGIPTGVKSGGSTGPSVRRVVDCGAIYNRDAYRRVEPKHFIRKRETLLPVSKAILELDSTSLSYPDAGKISA